MSDLMPNQPETVEEVFDEYHAEDRRKADISRLERDIEYGEMRLKRGAAFLRLESNADFKELIEEGYFREFADGAIKNLAKGKDGSTSKEEWMDVLTSIGHLKTYFEGIVQFNAQATTMLPQMKDELVRLKTANATFN